MGHAGFRRVILKPLTLSKQLQVPQREMAQRKVENIKFEVGEGREAPGRSWPSGS